LNNKNILKIFSDFNFVKKTIEIIQNSSEDFGIKILFGSAKSLFAASLLEKLNKKIILIAPSSEIAANYFDDFNILFEQNNDKIFLFQQQKSHKFKLENDTHLAELIDNISQFQEKKSAIAVTIPEIFNIKIPNSDFIKKHFCNLKKLQLLDIQQFTVQLSLNGFQKEQFVSKAGEFSVRGGIIDIFAPNMQNPIRIELWGDEIESIREFDTLSQRSLAELTEIDFIDSMFLNEEDEKSNEKNFGSNIFNFIPEDTIFIIDTPESIDFSKDFLQPISKFRKININPLGKTEISVNCSPQPNMHSSVQRFSLEINRNVKLNIQTFVAADGNIHLNRLKDLIEAVLTNDENDLISLNTKVTEDDFEFENELNNLTFNLEDAYWLDNSLSSGFYILENKIAYFVENEIFSRSRNTKANNIKTAKGITIRELKELKVGDFIVHSDKGIGKFDGFQTIQIGGSYQDCLRMIFADNDILYVHLNYMHKVQKYSAAEGVIPRLSKLGSTEWLRKKDRTKRKLKDIARDLITLYAKRKMQTGFAFPQDTTWQKEFEAAFIYEDTIDQAKTTIEVKQDMESVTPMDRLVCGDVGFGKTEIAIRAAFKAATAGKQTAVLVPTTILAQQHYFSFTERIHNYPVKVDVISRFRSPKEQKEIIQKVKENKIDILIGTHRILSKDIEFKNLGLLIVDEEHRFGVGSKEKLRQLKANIDTLTLTATPIPRTLNFSLMGARDLSQMETPPRNRLPVETEINEWNIEYVVNIILKEIKRNGQVFIVNDKIGGLDKMLLELQMALPSIRFAEIHGQMLPAHIEDIMESFTEKKFDVLLATKIIESGIDIPNANTIIINNAQNFGLAELYQLRGRVGRSNIQAYCHLLIPNVSHLPTKALRRLLAIEEFTDLGSGLQLAMRDLEIRGSGDLLGAEQSGFITEIGFDLYQKVLEEAVAELKKEEFSDIFEEEKSEFPKFDNDEINIETETDAFFPAEYLQDDTERFNYYKALFEVLSAKDLNNLVKEIEDRFGKMPEQALELIFVVKLRIAALNTGFTRIQLKENEIILDFPSQENKEYYEKIFPIVLEMLQLFDEMKLTQTKDKLTLRKQLENPEDENPASKREEAINFLWKLKKSIEINF
jgi:transcription-repair coupling factor (superfamily II helicase)